MNVSVIIPALNEGRTIETIIKECKRSKYVNEIIVSIDKATTDNTESIAKKSGAIVTHSNGKGFGFTFKNGIKTSKNDLIFKTDGDIRDFQYSWIDRCVESLDHKVGLVKTFWEQKKHTRSVTALTAKPMIKVMYPEISDIHLPLSGIYLFKKSCVEWQKLIDNWGFDLHLLLNVHSNNYTVKQIMIPEIEDRRKETKELIPMANEIASLLFSKKEKTEKKLKILLITAHPDDCEIFCGGTIAQTCLSGGEVKSIIITGNEERKQESITASQILPNYSLVFLGFKEFEDFVIKKAAMQIVEIIHDFKPDVLITHQPNDFHIDHRRVSELTLMSLLLLGHKNYPNRVYYCNTYFQRDRMSQSFSPDYFVDISEFFDLKKRLISVFKSQRVDYYIEMVEAMDKMNGIKSRVKFAESFLTCTTHLTNKANDHL